ncbi:MAG: AbrB/MazE/SpoVT family DNA-binding domain-containing protein [bacterium]|nr:AbrB/MazE/SpoVT family DNA-binding domain-containing protein [bacterium]
MNVRMDELGRVVIPAPVRDSLGLKKNSKLKMKIDETGTKLFIEKGQQELKLDYVSKVIVNSINNRFKYDCIVTNRDFIICTTQKYKNLNNEHISKEIIKNLESSAFFMKRVYSLHICENEVIRGNLYIFPIRENDDNVGALVVDYTSERYNHDFFEFIGDIIDY